MPHESHGPAGDLLAGDAHFYCPNCGYDLRGGVSDRCPECGHAIDPAALSTSQIPWSHRKTIGLRRAYWRTLKLLLRPSRTLAAEIARPVDYRDAQYFRFMTILTSSIPMIAVLAAWWFTAGRRERELTFIPHALRPLQAAGGCIVVIACIALIAALTSITGTPSYFFHPRSLPVIQQNRAVALSYYPGGLLAPCGFLAACAMGIWIVLIAGRIDDDVLIRWRPVVNLLLLVTSGGAAILLIHYLALVSGLLLRTTRCSILRPAAALLTTIVSTTLAAAAVLALPIIWRWIALILGFSA